MTTPEPPSTWSVFRRFFEAAQGTLAVVTLLVFLGGGLKLLLTVEMSSKTLESKVDASTALLQVRIDALTEEIQTFKRTGFINRLTAAEKDIEYLRSEVQQIKEDRRRERP